MEQTQVVRRPDSYEGYVRSEYKLLAQMRFDFPADPITELAKRLGRSAQTLYVWLRKPEYQAYESWFFAQQQAQWTPYERAIRGTVDESLQEFSSEMLERLRVIAETTQDEKLAASISQDWLDRAGHAAQRKLQSGTLSVVLTAEVVTMLLQRHAESHGEVVVGEVVGSDGPGRTPTDLARQ